MIAVRDDVGCRISPVVSHSGFIGRFGVLSGRMACVFAVGALLCVSSAQGQVIREEGFPVKGGVAEESAWAPVVREECDPFTVPGEFGESCVPREKTPDPFGFGPEGEARPGEPSGPAWRTPPRLECPVAIFLEELETGQVECYAWDASGEEHLEYSWEPVGNTTRDYLDNPRLTPEDVPNPSVVAPEAPAYETLESFRSGETTFLYRYRLTATSRATGLSSWREVEVYVSGSRPSVYCPLEVAVEEGSAVSLDCEGVDPLSHRMDYDEDGASILWEWEGLWGASTSLLDATDMSSALFTAPAGSAGEEYHYIASMTSQASGMPRTARRRVTVRVVGGEAVGDTVADIAATNGASWNVDCTHDTVDNEYHFLTVWSGTIYHVDEGDPDFTIQCRLTAEPGGAYTWSWTAAGGTANTSRLSAVDISSPVFDVPENVNGDTEYRYWLIASVVTCPCGDPPYEDRDLIRVHVRDTGPPPPSLACTHPDPVYEGTADITLDCSVTNEPTGAAYSWAVRGSTSNTNDLSSTTILQPTFAPPGDIAESGGANKDYEYTVTLSAGGVKQASEEVTVTVLEKPNIYPPCGITGYSFISYEGGADFQFTYCPEYNYTGAPGLSPVYRYNWTTRGSTPSTAISLLSATDVEEPFFRVPDAVSEDKRYEYTMTVSADNADPFLMSYAVNVKNKPPIVVTCEDPDSVYEGSADFTLDCSVENEPSDAAYSWTGADVANRLTGTDSATPTFAVPRNINETRTYSYRLTVSGGNTIPASADVTVTVLNKPDIVVTCPGNPYSVYEGSGDFELDCSASGAPGGSTYGYVWTARGSTTNTDMLSRADIASPTFYVPEEVDATTYEYLLTASAENAESGSADVTVTVLNKPDIVVTCPGNPYSVYEGSGDFELDCSASGAPGGSTYGYVWTARGSTTNTDMLSRADIASPTFYVPEEVDATTYEYLLTASAENAESGSAEVTVTVLNRGALAVICADPGSVYEGSADIAFDCSASGVPAGSAYEYAWTARGATTNTALLSGADIASPTFAVPDALDATTTYEYLLTASADGAESTSVDVEVKVLNRPSLAVACSPVAPVYEGSKDFALDCAASGAPGGSTYGYAWTVRGSTTNTDLLGRADIASPVFYVPEEVDATTTYEYLLTARAENAESGSAAVTVTVLNVGALRVVCADPPSVYEGSEDIAFDCAASGAPGGSAYEYEWTGRGSTTDTALLSAADGPAPTFDVPGEVDEDETYEYLLTVSAENADPASADVTVTVLNKGALALACADPGSVYEGSEDIAFDCAASGAPGGSAYEYEWTARNGTANTDLLIAGADGPAPTFDVPEEVDATTTYEYTLTVSAENADPASADVTVTVLNKGALALACADPGSVYEGSSDIAFDCSASGAPGGSTYGYAWTARGSTTNTDMLSGADIASPVFAVPEEVDATTTYEYTLTVSAENADPASADVTVTVLNKGALAVACADPGSVYEGSSDIAFDCSASGAPGGSTYGYAWTARGSTTNTDMLSGADIASPVFAVPEEVDATTTYEYTLTVSAENADPASADVTVKVLNKGALAVACADPGSVYEGSEDFALDCAASGAPGGSAYVYSWIAQGGKPDTGLLSATDIASPTFHVPDDVPQTTTYEYGLRVSAENAESAVALVRVTVLNKGALALVCADPGSVYEGSEDIAFDCAASGAPGGSAYEYEWTARGSTTNTDLLSGADIASPVFAVPEEVDATTTYEYTLTVSAENADPASADVTVTVLNKGALALACADPGSVYEGSADFALDCAASGAPGGSTYGYAWTAIGATPNTSRLSAADISSPTFHVPDALEETTTYEYLLTASAENAKSGSAEVTVTVLNRGALALACADPGSVYEGSEDIAFDCAASGAPGGSEYTYAWTARGSTTNTDLLSGADIASPVFAVPEEVDATTMYEYLLTASAENAEDATAEVTVTVLNKGALALACADPGSVYEGSADIAFDCSASGAPGDNPQYTYAWTARGDTPDTALLSATNIASPTFHVPDEVEEDETYEYLLTVSAANAKDAAADVTVTVLDRIRMPDPEPVSPPVDSPPLASSSARAPSDPTALGVRVSASSLRFGVQSAQTRASLDPMTDQISTRVSGPYHAGRMTLSPGGGASFDENGEMSLSIELASPVVLRRKEGGIEAALIVLAPNWSFAESCEQLSSQAIGGLYTEATLTEGACRLLRFGGELDLTDAPSGRYAGAIDVVLRSGESEETHSVEVEVTVVPSQRVITIGPGGVRFSTSREVPAGLTEDQSLSIYPDVAFLTEGKPNGAFELSNPSLIPLEVSVSARFGYTEATENGREVVIESPDGSRLGDLSKVVDIHPGVLVLQPGEKGLIRYGVQEGALAAMEEQGYAAFFDVVSSPRQYVRTDRMPEEVTGERTARVTMRVPGVYVPGEGASQLRARLLSLSYGVSMSATFLLETQDRPFAGEVVAYDGQGRELGRRETLVYTRSRVRVPLDRMPEEEVVFLRFAPWGSSRVPEPTSVEWNAPGRDIGDVGYKEKTPARDSVKAVVVADDH